MTEGGTRHGKFRAPAFVLINALAEDPPHEERCGR
ncbi:MAG: hypothetical protein K0R44_229 [Thermomicrobiales bacterium]|nr:hypothetical protein [Thermomicrobiales bacterium]MDF3015004.1 hypothetical protein [Thermomicrobiales bacterium]